MTLATTTADGRPSARMVLLKGVDERGLVFYTNQQSRKAGELEANGHAALLFHWKSLRRQVRVEGPVEHTTPAEADAYFATRARISRLGAWASDQSRPLPQREMLETRLAEMETRYPGEDVPRPPHWSGYRVLPEAWEFWQNMPYRLHDRTVFTRAAGGRDGSSASCIPEGGNPPAPRPLARRGPARGRESMFIHHKELLHPVEVKDPDPRFGQFLLEQFGSATGELTAALQYWVQSFHVEDPGIRDMLQDIAVEEFGHLEMVGKMIEQHTRKLDQTDVYAAPHLPHPRAGAALHRQPGPRLDRGLSQRGR